MSSLCITLLMCVCICVYNTGIINFPFSADYASTFYIFSVCIFSTFKLNAVLLDLFYCFK